jgi:hypothetical protein
VQRCLVGSDHSAMVVRTGLVAFPRNDGAWRWQALGLPRGQIPCVFWRRRWFPREAAFPGPNARWHSRHHLAAPGHATVYGTASRKRITPA